MLQPTPTEGDVARGLAQARCSSESLGDPIWSRIHDKASCRGGQVRHSAPRVARRVDVAATERYAPFGDG